MMPKKGRKNIVIDDIGYHYKIRLSDTFVYVIIQNTKTQEIIEWSEESKGGRLNIPHARIEQIIRKHNKGVSNEKPRSNSHKAKVKSKKI